jgi:hypothetical protein
MNFVGDKQNSAVSRPLFSEVINAQGRPGFQDIVVFFIMEFLNALKGNLKPDFGSQKEDESFVGQKAFHRPPTGPMGLAKTALIRKDNILSGQKLRL